MDKIILITGGGRGIGRRIQAAMDALTRPVKEVASADGSGERRTVVALG
jgi:short-subunit dehydrogenase involved in D-alanine esterification of teichoic acids